jgi:hypothetical protein
MEWARSSRRRVFKVQRACERSRVQGELMVAADGRDHIGAVLHINIGPQFLAHSLLIGRQLGDGVRVAGAAAGGVP